MAIVNLILWLVTNSVLFETFRPTRFSCLRTKFSGSVCVGEAIAVVAVCLDSQTVDFLHTLSRNVVCME